MTSNKKKLLDKYDANKANKEICKFLAKQLGIALRDVEIVAGHIMREKTVKIVGVSFDDIIMKLDLQPTLPLF
jgi:uncharacterized protein YggU (UPF0235/DUF167 family)